MSAFELLSKKKSFALPWIGSPRLNRIGLHKARMKWEYNESLRASTSGTGERRGGSFRVSDEDLAQMGFEPPAPFPVKGNTLVLADIRGFHRRGQAKPGSKRFGLYANVRPHPFKPFRH